MNNWSLALTLVLTAAAGAASASAAPATEDSVFRFHLLSEPHSIDPVQISGSETSYFFSTIYRGLFLFHSSSGLKPEGAKKCTRQGPLKMTCQLNTKFKWNDGAPVKAEEYAAGFKRLMDPANKSRSIDLLLTVKNVSAPDSKTLVFEFSEPDYDFEYKLTSPALVPFRKIPTRENPAGGFYNGPYIVSEWQKGKRIVMTPNPHYPLGNPKRPNVEALVLEEDATATVLFEKKKLQFQRRLPTAYIPAWEKNPAFLQVPLARFDYIGFGPDLKDLPDLRKALSHALDYEEFKKIFYSKTRPGCPGVSESMANKIPCVDFDLKKAKEFLAKVPEPLRKKRWTMTYSLLGGDDIRRGAEWLQNQWKKHLALNIEVASMEQKIYLHELKTNPPAIFRKGVSLDRPTCLAAVENLSTENPENFVRYDNPKYQAILKSLRREVSAAKRRKLCSEALNIMIRDYRLIPWGNFAYTMLVDRRFSGWDINQLNQLELSGLKFSP